MGKARPIANVRFRPIADISRFRQTVCLSGGSEKDPTLRKLQVIAMTLAALPLIAARPVGPQRPVSLGAVFALIDNNEWCPGGSVYLDLRTGSFMLYPRFARPACSDPKMTPTVERGTLGEPALRHLRAAVEVARSTGLRRGECEPVVSNGGPKALVITAASYSETTPDELGCWSLDATTLYQKIFEVFGQKRPLRK